MDKKLFKSILFIIAYCVVLVAVIINIEWVISTAGWILSLLSPIFIGFAIAFLLNRPYMFFKKLYSAQIPRKNQKKPVKQRSEKAVARLKNLRKALALLTVYILFLAMIALLLWLIIPEITNSISQISTNIELYIKNLNNLLNDFNEWLPFDISFTEPILTTEVNEDGTSTKISIAQFLSQKLTELTSILPNILSGIFPDLFHMTKSILSSVMNILLGFVMSIYMLASKESLLSQCRHFFDAYAPKKIASKTYEVLEISREVFSNFVSGRLYDALIIGMICFVGMSIFKFQYTLLISVVVAVTNVIPIFGPFIGAIPSICLLLLVDPMQAVWFTIFIIVLQQIDGNVIGPKVVGDSIGLPAWWVMVSILIGGGFLGVFGMLAGVPTFAVIYKMLKKSIHYRLEKKGLEHKESKDE